MFDDIKGTFQRQGDGFQRLLVLNILFFVVSFLLDTFFKLSQLHNGFLTDLFYYLGVHAYLPEFVTKPWAWFSYMFVHRDFMHILFNMLWFYWIGQIFMEYLGSKKLVSAYIMGGLAGAWLYQLAFNLVPFFKVALQYSYVIGASASVLAVVVGTATLLPDYTIRLILFGNVKLKYLAAVMVFLDLISTVGSNAGGAVAHLGGALFGFLYIRGLQNGKDYAAPITYIQQWLEDRKSNRKPAMKVVYQKKDSTKSSNSYNKQDPHIQSAELDKILDKISAQGYESLSKEEKELLFKAGNKG